MASDIRTEKIHVDDNARQRLKQLLGLSISPDELEDAGWDYGTPLAEVKRLVKYWKDEYNWQEAEDDLNTHTHHFTPIQVDGFDPIDIHFLHNKSPVPNSIPLLFLHGWPGSFHEGLKIIGPLSSGDGKNEPAFDVVVMSLPNYGFSQGVSKRGFALAQYAETAHKLMLKLGYNQYVTQGGDWGYYITRAMAILYPEHVKATHINFDYGGGAPTFSEYPLLALEHALTPYTEKEKEGLKRTKWFMDESSGYRAIQATKPQTSMFLLLLLTVHSTSTDQFLPQTPSLTQLTPHSRLRPRLLPLCPPRLPPRETPRLDRRLPLHGPRNLHLGLPLLVQPRRARRVSKDLLRSDAPASRR